MINKGNCFFSDISVASFFDWGSRYGNAGNKAVKTGFEVDGISKFENQGTSRFENSEKLLD